MGSVVRRRSRRVDVERGAVQQVAARRAHQGGLGLGLNRDGTGVVDVRGREGQRGETGRVVQDHEAGVGVAGVQGLLGRVAELLLHGRVLARVGVLLGLIGGRGDGAGDAEVVDGGGVAVVQLDGLVPKVGVAPAVEVVALRHVGASDGNAVLDLDRGAERSDRGAGLGAVLLDGDLVGDHLGRHEQDGEADTRQNRNQQGADQDGGVVTAEDGARAGRGRLDGFHERLLEEYCDELTGFHVSRWLRDRVWGYKYSAASGLSYTLAYFCKRALPPK